VRWARDNALGLFFGAILLAALVGQALVGHSEFNHDQLAHAGATISLGRYVTSSSFMADVMENWQSEYLQFTLYAVTTVWFIQRGSSESKAPGEEGPGTDEEQLLREQVRRDSPKWARAGGWRTAIYSRSMLLAMGAIWLATWGAQAVSGRIGYNAGQLDHRLAPLSLWQYLGSSDFWDRTLQNWQSEFLAVGSFAVFAVFLRQRGSPESKPVGAPHSSTGSEV
jgi:hypothetical protein